MSGYFALACWGPRPFIQWCRVAGEFGREALGSFRLQGVVKTQGSRTGSRVEPWPELLRTSRGRRQGIALDGCLDCVGGPGSEDWGAPLVEVSRLFSCRRTRQGCVAEKTQPSTVRWRRGSEEERSGRILGRVE